MKFSIDDVMNTYNSLNIENNAFIGGKYVKSISGKVFNNVSPIDGKVITEITECDHEDIDVAVNEARKAYNKGSWSKISSEDRKKILNNFADLIEKNLFEIGVLETIDVGKPISHSLGEITRCANTIRWYAEVADKLYDKIAPTKKDVIALITKEPVGVVGAITPWNYPLLMAVWKLAPALALGNSFILKPAEQSPLTAIKVAELAMEAGIPEGVFNVVPGYGPTAGKALAMHKDVDKISFTGSTEVGRLILQYSGLSNMKRVSLECGGKSPNIIFSDAKDLDFIAEETAGAMFYNSGQVCDAPTRLLIERSIKDEFLDRVMNYSKSYMPSNPLQPETKMGSMVDKSQTERVLDYIKKGMNEGGKLIMGGNQILIESGGYYIEPTIFSEVKNTMTIAREEIFGPVLSVIEFESFDDAITISNDTDYGLNAVAWTNDINKALKISKMIHSGKILINSFSDSAISVPHGGFKQSGFGRDKSLEALDQYSQTKLTWIEIN